MSEKLHDTVSENDEGLESATRGVTRRELFQIGNVLALPVLLGHARAEALTPRRSSREPSTREPR